MDLISFLSEWTQFSNKNKKKGIFGWWKATKEDVGGDLSRIYFGMPMIGRFAGVDPIAEQYPAWSPFNYVLGNPVLLIDPDGREPMVGEPPIIFIISYQVRGSFLLTSASTLSIGYDFQTGNVGIMHSVSYGAGITIGATGGFTAGVMVSNSFEELTGRGVNFGVYTTIGVSGLSVNGSAEINSAWEYSSPNKLEDIDFGINGSSPLMGGGLGIGMYSELDWTTLDFEGTPKEAWKFLIENSFQEVGEKQLKILQATIVEMIEKTKNIIIVMIQIARQRVVINILTLWCCKRYWVYSILSRSLVLIAFATAE